VVSVNINPLKYILLRLDPHGVVTVSSGTPNQRGSLEALCLASASSLRAL